MRRARAFLLLSILWTPVRPATAGPTPTSTTLAVPFLPQTEALCGGAAAAMVFRYWGDRHADVQQFAPLVDRRAGGIAAGDLAQAIADRGWRTQRLAAQDGGEAFALLRSHLDEQRPVILLIEDRPQRYHFVVAVGADGTHVWLHDPTWGPSRRQPAAALLEKWKASGYWALLIQPDGALAPNSPAPRVPPAPPVLAPEGSAAAVPASCERALEDAIARVEAEGLGAADEALAAARDRCPGSSRPTSELAGVRFAQERYRDAIALADRALALDARDAHAWDVLGSGRFMLDDHAGALRAWNRIGRPALDGVTVEGLVHTRYAAFARMLPLEPNTNLAAADFELAERRVAELPSVAASRVSLVPEVDGWARVRVAIVERRTWPRGIAAASVAAARIASDREVRVDVPGWNGEGDRWGFGWRWWEERPRVDVRFGAPVLRGSGGVWHVEGSWMAQQYRDAGTQAAPTREARSMGTIRFGNWATPNLRYDASVSVAAWQGSRRAAGAGGEIERRFAADRVAIAAGGRTWRPIGSGQPFHAAHLLGSLRTDGRLPAEPAWTAIARAGLVAVSDAAPLSEWPSPGDADPRAPLLRAHPFTQRGIVDSPAFGRRLAFSSVEGRRWLETGGLVRVGLAAFVDAA
ncbi:MAG: C39 family peptidase, partial [Vicinamibacterales bacterium]